MDASKNYKCQVQSVLWRGAKWRWPCQHGILCWIHQWLRHGQKTCAIALFGMGCFWGAERKFWQADGVYSTQVGYAAGLTPNPTYEEVCSGATGHNEVVQVVFDTDKTDFEKMLQIFWENHNPTQGMRQGNDVGTQYRSGIYTHSSAQKQAALASRDAFQSALRQAGYDEISTEIDDTPIFYYAENYHQQYLGKNPNGYCGLGGVGVSCPIGVK